MSIHLEDQKEMKRMVSPILISLAALSSIACFITTLMALRAVSEFYKKLRDMEELYLNNLDELYELRETRHNSI